jgi:hypothetical protein
MNARRKHSSRARKTWHRAFRLFRMIRCPVPGVDWTEAEKRRDLESESLPYNICRVARAAAWCGKTQDPLSMPMQYRREYHRAGCYVPYTLFGATDRAVRLPR